MTIKTIYMQSTIKYLIEVYGSKTTNELSVALNSGKPKMSKDGIAYILIE